MSERDRQGVQAADYRIYASAYAQDDREDGRQVRQAREADEADGAYGVSGAAAEREGCFERFRDDQRGIEHSRFQGTQSSRGA